MNNKVLETIVSKELLNAGDKVIVALSGGADSVSLLHLLLSLGDKLHITVMAAHVNHQLRGDESVRDMDFVTSLCSSLSVKLFTLTENVRLLSQQSGKSEELVGREVRYGFFEQLHREHNAKIATAHTLSDSEETMLYNMARGATLHGLCSIPYKRDYIVRPLLDVTRSEVEEYCSGNSLKFVQDSTNFCEDVCKRNKIRLSVLPRLREINQGFDSNFLRLRSQLNSVDEYMQGVAKQELEACRCEFGLDAPRLAALPDGLLGYVLNQYLVQCGASAEYCHIELCKDLLLRGGAVCLPKGFTAVCRQGIFRCVSMSNPSSVELPVTASLTFSYAGNKYSLKELSKNEIINRKLASSCIACDIIDNDTVIRTRREGDTFTPQKRSVTKPLRKLQNELRIPSELRPRSLVIAKGSVVLWAEHIGVSQQGLVFSDSDKGIYIEITKGDNNA